MMSTNFYEKIIKIKIIKYIQCHKNKLVKKNQKNKIKYKIQCHIKNDIRIRKIEIKIKNRMLYKVS